MSAVSGASVLGASLGSSGVRTVVSDNARPGPIVEVHEPVASRPAPNGLAPDPWDAVVTSVHNLANEYASADFYPVLALRESDPKTAYDQDFSDGVVLVSELGAQVGALRETGVLAGEACVALFDVGASGTSMSVVDVDSGRVLAARRTEELSGDVCDQMLCDHVISMFGAAEALTVDARRRLVDDVRAGKHDLSALRSATVLGPFVGGRATLWRGNLDELIGDSVHRAVSMAVDVLDAVRAQGIHVDAVVAVGGGANMQIVRQVLFDAVSAPVYVPEQPELLAARGAAGIARTVGVRPVPATPDAITEQFAAVGSGPAVREVASKRPRHSDTSARRMTRVNKSRHLGGALAALVAVCAAGTVVAAAARTGGDEPASSVGSSQDASETTRSQSVVPAADGSPADLEQSSLPLPTTTGSSAPSSSSEAPTTIDAASSTTSRRTVSPSGTEDAAAPDRSTPDRTTTVVPTTVVPPTVVPTTVVPPTTTRAPATTTRAPATTTTPRSTTTTRSPRTFEIPFPNLDLPRR
ncbi:hypothetical protein CH275_05685 [Rhodococcus sp. 06-235-1A]|uniref:Hsp70 family protein n=1 Tax=Rhodococcus sp. 06-235-1A TaxID=2022508 RepID=UPI000B9C0058|nr:Hsp70 family protein [Rhodococcus sp. 06-235-1A]OZD08054.1 hypothetical protein CH275_05685 [Rhodococcus sp. 06-235-1A]